MPRELRAHLLRLRARQGYPPSPRAARNAWRPSSRYESAPRTRGSTFCTSSSSRATSTACRGRSAPCTYASISSSTRNPKGDRACIESATASTMLGVRPALEVLGHVARAAAAARSAARGRTPCRRTRRWSRPRSRCRRTSGSACSSTLWPGARSSMGDALRDADLHGRQEAGEVVLHAGQVHLVQDHVELARRRGPPCRSRGPTHARPPARTR